MKLIHFIRLVLSIMIPSFAFCQDGVYGCDNYQNNNKCSLFLEIREGKYMLQLGYMASEDNITGATLSIGKSCEKEKEIVLEDELFGYPIVFERIDPNVLVLKQGFQPMIGSVFEYLREPTSSLFVYNSDTRDFHRNPYHIKKDNHKARFERKNGFQAGSYAIGDEFEKIYRLNLEESGRFNYQYRSVILSEGSWRRCGNLLILNDDGMNKPFFAIIKENGIISSLLPGAYTDSIWNLED